jgi:undecaprenyl-diphosphatase
MEFWQAALLAVVEGVTEYLPISSTGHIILGSWAMGIVDLPFTKDFTVMVQFGAILAVVVIYWRRFFQDWRRMYPRLAVAFLPAGIIGLAVKNKIDVLLGSVWIVALALIVGGVALIFTNRIFAPRENAQLKDVGQITYMQAFYIGLFQCLAFVPGMSRAASTIWGALYVGLNLSLATQFSFLLAVPTLSGATLIKAIKVAPTLTSAELQLILVGNIISFIVGYAAIRSFVSWVQRRGLEPFGYYRIVLGAVVVAMLLMGHELAVV